MTVPITCDLIDHQILLLIFGQGYIISENGNVRNLIVYIGVM